MKKPPQEIIDIMKKHKIKSADLWDCHGTWVLKHKAVLQLAAAEGVMIVTSIEHHDQDKKHAIFRCTADKDNQSYTMWGEAAPYNSTNSYPIAIAQKRAEDRAIIAALMLSGYVYSEVEADDFKQSAGRQAARQAPATEPVSMGRISKSDTVRAMQRAAGSR